MVPPAETPRELVDRWNRPLRDLRISVTDRCNFRCTYCLPRDAIGPGSFLPREEILNFEEIQSVCRLFVERGVRKIRVTGGEPLLRRQLARLIGMLAELDVELALTTNGVLLPEFASELKAAGLHRITVSLDAMDARVFQTMCDAPSWGPVDVLRGIAAAETAGFESIKINCAVRRGVNDDQIVPIARHFAGTGHVVRFIEFMDVGTRNAWTAADVFSAREIRERLAAVDELEPLVASYRGEVARRYHYRQGGGEVGIISSVSEPFCGDCTRARLAANGRLFSCLFAHQGFDLREALRGSSDPEEIGSLIDSWWKARQDRYSEQRTSAEQEAADVRRLSMASSKIEMSFIGG